MERPPLEEPGPPDELGRLSQSSQGRVRGASDHRHLLGRGRRSFLRFPSIPPTLGPRNSQHKPRLDTQGAWASRQLAFPFTCAGEWALPVSLSHPEAPPSLHTASALISPLVLQASLLGVWTQACPKVSEVAAASQSPLFPPLPSGLHSSSRPDSGRAGRVGYSQGNGAVRQEAGFGRLREVPAAAHHPPTRGVGGAAA